MKLAISGFLILVLVAAVGASFWLTNTKNNLSYSLPVDRNEVYILKTRDFQFVISSDKLLIRNKSQDTIYISGISTASAFWPGWSQASAQNGDITMVPSADCAYLQMRIINNVASGGTRKLSYPDGVDLQCLPDLLENSTVVVQ